MARYSDGEWQCPSNDPRIVRGSYNPANGTALVMVDDTEAVRVPVAEVSR
jgi:hypothetical protein